MANYNTGVTFSKSSTAHTTPLTGTIPAGVLTGDVMIVSIEVFTFNGAVAGFTTPTSGGGNWTQIGTTLSSVQSGGPFPCFALAFYRVATASDPGSTFSITFNGTVGSTDQFWWAGDLEAYTGFYTAAPIGNVFTVNNVNATTITAPSGTTARTGSWAVYTCQAPVNGSGNITGEPATSRHVINPGAGINTAVSDSNGSAGGAGAGIGGGTWTLSNSSAGGGAGYTIELCTQAPSGPVIPQVTPPRIPHPRFLDLLLEEGYQRADWQAQGVASLAPFTWRLMDGVNGRPGGSQVPQFVQSASSTSISGATVTVTLGAATTPGNCLVIASGVSQASANPTITGITLGGSADHLAQLVTVGDPVTTSAILEIWADPNCAGGQTSVVITYSVNPPNTACVEVYEFSGVATAAPLDRSSTGFSTSTQATWDSGTTATTTQPSELWFGADSGFSTTTTGPGAPWINSTVITSGARNLIAGYQIVSSTGTADYSGTYSPNSYENAAVVTLKGATGGTPPPATATANSTGKVLGTGFYVTQGGLWFTGYWWWVAPAGGQPTTPQKFALWNVTSQTTGTVIPGSVVTSGTLSSGWNYIPLPAPVQLAIWGYYCATTQTAGPFPDTTGQFGSGQPYAAGISNGPLAAFSDSGGGNAPPYSRNQAVVATGSDPAVTLPSANGGTHDNFYLDVQVTNVPPAGYQGSYRLWPNMADGDFATGIDAAVNYVIGTEIITSQACYVNRIWYYIPSGTAQFATSADIWRVRDGVRVATQKTPVWRQASGAPATTASGLGGTSQQWVWCDLPGPVYLQPGDYYVTVYNGNGSPDGWGAKRLYYWESGNVGGTSYQTAPPGQAGITTGPLYAPPTPLASTINDFTSGLPEPGQSVFAVGPPNQFPNQYVGNGPGVTTALFQNYWVDLEVTPASTWTPDEPNLPAQIPHPLFMDLLEIAARKMEPDSGTAPVPPGVATITGQGALGDAATQGSGGTLGGQGGLGSPASAVQAPATMAGGGSLTGLDITVQAPGTLAGQGTVSDAAAEAAPATLTGLGTVGDAAGLGAGGTLGGQGTIGPPPGIIAAPATLTGQGALAGAAIEGAGGGLAGQGDLGSPASAIIVPATIAGQGSVNASTSPQGDSTLTGQGALPAAAVLQAPAVLAGQGTIGLPVLSVAVTALLQGAGQLAATGTVPGGGTGAGTITGGGALAAPATVLAVAMIAGQGRVTAATVAVVTLGYARAGTGAAPSAQAGDVSTDPPAGYGTARAGTWP